MKNLCVNNNQGFSMIEMLIVFGMMMMISVGMSQMLTVGRMSADIKDLGGRVKENLIANPADCTAQVAGTNFGAATFAPFSRNNFPYLTDSMVSVEEPTVTGYSMNWASSREVSPTLAIANLNLTLQSRGQTRIVSMGAHVIKDSTTNTAISCVFTGGPASNAQMCLAAGGNNLSSNPGVCMFGDTNGTGIMVDGKTIGNFISGFIPYVTATTELKASLMRSIQSSAVLNLGASVFTLASDPALAPATRTALSNFVTALANEYAANDPIITAVESLPGLGAYNSLNTSLAVSEFWRIEGLLPQPTVPLTAAEPVAAINEIATSKMVFTKQLEEMDPATLQPVAGGVDIKESL